MNDELPPIPDDPQQSFGSPMEHIERLFSSKGHPRAVEWWIVGPGDRIGQPHNAPSLSAAIEAIEHRIGPVFSIAAPGPVTTVKPIDPLVIRSARVGPLGSHPSTSQERDKP